MIEMFLKNIMRVSLIGGIGIIVVMILKKNLFKKYTQAFNYYIWISIVIAMIIPFKIKIYVPQGVSEKLNDIWSIIPNIQKSETLISNINDTNEPIISNSIINYNLLTYLWLIVTVLITIYLIIGYFRFISKVKSLECDVTDDNINIIYSELLSEMNIKKKIGLKFCNGISSTLGIGLSKPLILLPTADYSYEEIRWILKHELIHFKRHDILYKTIVMSVIVLHWFNPLVYIMLKIFNTDCELSCDEEVLENLNIEERKLYASTLISSIRLNIIKTTQSSMYTAFSNDKTILKRRLENMLNMKRGKKGILAGVLAIAVVSASLVSIGAFASTDNNNTPTLTTEQKQAADAITIAKLKRDAEVTLTTAQKQKQDAETALIAKQKQDAKVAANEKQAAEATLTTKEKQAADAITIAKQKRDAELTLTTEQKQKQDAETAQIAK